MIIQVINTENNSVKDYLSRKYKVFTNLFDKEVVEIRKLDIDYNKELIEVLNTCSINYLLLEENSLSNFLIIIEQKLLLNKIKDERFSSSKVIQQMISSLENYSVNPKKKYEINNVVFNFDKAYLMGILNITPDSFSDGGKYINLDDAFNYGLKMIDDGVDIIDIGGESTRPGSNFISVEEEKRRVLPVIEKLLKYKSDLIISVDTTKSQVAESALNLGAKIINDISGMTLDKNMINVCSREDATVILMHIQGIPKTMQINPTYDEVISDIYDFLYQRIIDSELAGINKLIIDMGIGFGKNIEDNFQIIKRLKEFTTLGYPILIGLSRKSFIGKTLNLEVSERDFPSAILETISLMNSARIIRTHNTKNGRTVVDLINKII